MYRGGALIAQGADTCVFAPHVACRPGTEFPQGPLPPGDYVSRLISQDNRELDIQMAVGDAILRIQEMYPDVPLLEHMNFATKACRPQLRQDELAKADGTFCRLRNKPPLNSIAQQNNYINLITPRQDEDIRRIVVVNGVETYELTRPLEITLAAMRPMVHCLAALNGEGMCHFDAHSGNIAWVGDRIMIHDWGQAKTEQQYRYRFFEQDMANPQRRAYMKEFAQHALPIMVFERFMNPDGTHDLTDNQKSLFFRMHDTLATIGAMLALAPEKRPAANISLRIATALIRFDFPVESAAEGIHLIVNSFFESPMSPETQSRVNIYTQVVGPVLAPVSGLLSLKEMQGGNMSMTSKFNRCVKSVKKTIRPRKGSTAESGAIAVCTTSILHPRGRTLKSYSRSRLQTQRRR